MSFAGEAAGLTRTSPFFLNVDLEIASKAHLDSLAREMGSRVVVLYSGPVQRLQVLVVESSRQHKGPDSVIHDLCSLVELLSPDARRIWDAARKDFDIGYELGASERSSRFTLRPDTLERVARLGATLTVTYYRGERPPIIPSLHQDVSGQKTRKSRKGRGGPADGGKAGVK